MELEGSDEEEEEAEQEGDLNGKAQRLGTAAHEKGGAVDVDSGSGNIIWPAPLSQKGGAVDVDSGSGNICMGDSMVSQADADLDMEPSETPTPH